MNQTVDVPAHLRCDFVGTMPDDSMSDKGIYAGDKISFVTCDHVKNGQIAAVKVGDKIFVRTVWADGRLLAPANPAYMTKVFNADELSSVQIIGRAVEVRHILNPAGSPESTLPKHDPKEVPV